ncbi:MAG: NAD(P)-dependent alcohol dehydrogenase [Nocardiopsaceae bacterium]|nr:NAD(P)-dependent alcohol dehydrogenase [Nocardiopsaceae bacterium]
MKAAVHTRYGPPGVVRITEVEKPSAGDNELIVKVHATTVNRTDSGLRAAKPFFSRFVTGLRKPRGTVLGNEFAGTVETVGSGVTSFAPGDRVFGFSGFSGPFGGHAEYIRIREDSAVAAIPADLGYETVAAGTEGAHYALSNIRKAKITRDHKVLVYGATGAIGSAAVQLLKSMGATVTAVCATDSLTLVRSLGADRVVDYTAQDFTKDSQRYHVVFDAVGKSSFLRCRPLLRPGGIYLATEGGIGFLLLILITALLPGKRVMFALPKLDQSVVQHLAALMESGQFKPVIDRTYPLEEIVPAYEYVETGQKIGNVVITVCP